MEDGGGDKHVHELRESQRSSQSNGPDQILVMNLTETSVGELEVAVVVNITVQLFEFFFAVILKDSGVIDTLSNTISNLLCQGGSPTGDR